MLETSKIIISSRPVTIPMYVCMYVCFCACMYICTVRVTAAKDNIIRQMMARSSFCPWLHCFFKITDFVLQHLPRFTTLHTTFLYLWTRVIQADYIFPVGDFLLFYFMKIRLAPQPIFRIDPRPALAFCEENPCRHSG